MIYFLRIILFLAFSIIESFLLSVNCEKVETLNGRYTRNIKEYELLVPQKVNYLGEFQSYELSHFFDHDFKLSRQKRGSADAVHYKVFFNDQEHLLELWANHGFLSPSMVSEYHYPYAERSISARSLNWKNPILCHFTGTVRDDSSSRVAISTCNGLTGHIQTSNGSYFIEPLNDHGPNEEGQLLHIIHKRSSINHKKRFCGTSNWDSSWKNSLANINHKKVSRNSRETHSKHRYMEVLVVADKSFLDYHRGTDYETYILTVMNMVFDLYRDYSIGNMIDIVVVRIVYLELDYEAMNLEISTNAYETLPAFCKWAESINPKDSSHPQHHDAAVLLTKLDLCGETSCDLLGLANVAAACDPKHSCAVNEDYGLQLGFVVAHELGHLLGCDHDEADVSGCAPKENDKTFHVMGPFLTMSSNKWSKCSRTYITELFENNLGECLNDEPLDSPYKFNNVLPGTIYDANYQCNVIFPNSTLCTANGEGMCQKLFCRAMVNGKKKCRSNSEPPADGTKCAHDKWCYKKECVRIGARPESIPGGWSEWQEYSKCSRECGVGIQISERECNNPVPQNNGRYCLGERKRYRICNTQTCPSGSKSYRLEQCEEFNNKTDHKWIPRMIPGKNKCSLFCMNQKWQVGELSKRVKDGTLCRPGTNDICLAGVCRKVGCDWQIDSTAIEDPCGVCNGEGTECKLVNETLQFDGKETKRVVTIPKNSRNIAVKKLAPSKNRILISDSSTKKILMKDSSHFHEGEINLDGNLGLIDLVQPNQEELYIKGPLTKDLELTLHFSKHENVAYFYQFALLTANKTAKPLHLKSQKEFLWDFVEFSECSVRCGGGYSEAKAVCVSEIDMGEVPDKLCSRSQKPHPKMKVCNKQECSVKWQVGEWGSCKKCEDEKLVQSRKVSCIHESPKWEENPVLVDEKKCMLTDGTKPHSKQLCTKNTDSNCPKPDTNKNRTDKQEPLFDSSSDNLNLEISNSICDAKNSKMVPKNQHHPILDKVPGDHITVLEVPEVSHEYPVLSDEAYRKLGDKVESTYNLKDRKIYEGSEAKKILKSNPP